MERSSCAQLGVRMLSVPPPAWLSATRTSEAWRIAMAASSGGAESRLQRGAAAGLSGGVVGWLRGLGLGLGLGLGVGLG